ncbi:MAG: hypothetical protein R6U37_01245 [Dehalococcoidia bacterium]
MRKFGSRKTAERIPWTCWRALFGILAISLLAISMVIVPAAIAEENETAESTPQPAQTTTENEEAAPPLFNSFMNKLAENLGVTTDELQSAVAQTEQQMISEAAEKGMIAEEKAEDMQAYIQENGSMRGYGLSVAQQQVRNRLQQAVDNGIISEEQFQAIDQRFQKIREKVMERIQNRPGLREGWEEFRNGQSGNVWDRVRSLWENRVQDRLHDRLHDIGDGSGTRTLDVELPELTPELPGTVSGAQNGPGAAGR